MSGTLHLINHKKKEKITNLSFYHSKNLPKKHNHIKIKFSNFTIVYNDPRRFGFFKLLNSKKEVKKYFQRFGPEATSSKFNFKYIKLRLMNKKKILRIFY